MKRLLQIFILIICLIFTGQSWALYTAEVTDVSKWWITGTGSVVNRLSEVMDDVPLGPYCTFLDADNAWTQNGATNEWWTPPAQEPDDVAESLAAWHTYQVLPEAKVKKLR